MIFASPIWLLALAPWAALLLWLLSGQLEKSPVPFLHLWPAADPQLPKPKRARQTLPLWLIAILAAMLLAIFAAAGPRLLHRQSSRITLIVDRGFASPFAQSAKNLDEALRQNFPAADIDLKIIPTVDSTTGHDWLTQVSSLQPTAAHDLDELTLACRDALRTSDAPVILLSNQTIELNDPRLIQFTSQTPATNVGIDLLSIRASPKAQAMIRLFNQSNLNAATLILRSDGIVVQSQQITLPPVGLKQDYFVDLPAAPQVVEAEIQCDDSIKINHRAWAIRSQAWPIIEPLQYLSPELTRLIEVYGRHRIPSENSPHIVVTTDLALIPANTPAAILASESTGSATLSIIHSLTVRDDLPNIPSLDWSHILAGATISPPPSQESTQDWQPIISANGSPVVAIRDTSTKQVWIGFHANDFARQPDFVIFWSAIFDWLGSANSPEYTSQTIGPITSNWRLQQPTDIPLSPTDNGLIPGLYKSASGALLAINAPAPQIQQPPQSDADTKLKSLAQAN
ncbi:MAG TPA: hypothetical protein VGG44_04250, partial [Tepidisphaeraceae bacterium]